MIASSVSSTSVGSASSASASGSNVGALAASAYLLIGRALRARLSLTAYVWLVYGVAAVVLCAMASSEGARVSGFAWIAYASVAADPSSGGTAATRTVRYILSDAPTSSGGLATTVFQTISVGP